VKLNPKQKAALKARLPKLKVAMDEGIDTDGVENALEEALEEVQALGEAAVDPNASQDGDDNNAEIAALLKQLLAKFEGGSTAAADDEVAKTAEAAKKAEAAKNAAAMDAKIKDATDGVRDSIEGRFKAAEKVRPLVGNIDAMAFDSAEAIFSHTLKVGGLKPEDHKPEAYSGIVDVLIANQTKTPVHSANDEKGASELLTAFPALSKIKHA
jgi:hypothetical protein